MDKMRDESSYPELTTLKVVYNGMARRVRIPYDMGWSAFESKICGIFNLNPPLVTCYKDEMGVSVIVDNNDDFFFFLDEENTGRLEILTNTDGAEVTEWTVVRNLEEKKVGEDDIANGALSPLTIETSSVVDSNYNPTNSPTGGQNISTFEDETSQGENIDDIAIRSIVIDQSSFNVSSPFNQSVQRNPESSHEEIYEASRENLNSPSPLDGRPEFEAKKIKQLLKDSGFLSNIITSSQSIDGNPTLFQKEISEKPAEEFDVPPQIDAKQEEEEEVVIAADKEKSVYGIYEDYLASLNRMVFEVHDSLKGEGETHLSGGNEVNENPLNSKTTEFDQDPNFGIRIKPLDDEILDLKSNIDPNLGIRVTPVNEEMEEDEVFNAKNDSDPNFGIRIVPVDESVEVDKSDEDDFNPSLEAPVKPLVDEDKATSTGSDLDDKSRIYMSPERENIPLDTGSGNSSIYAKSSNSPKSEKIAPSNLSNKAVSHDTTPDEPVNEVKFTEAIVNRVVKEADGNETGFSKPLEQAVSNFPDYIISTGSTVFQREIVKTPSDSPQSNSQYSKSSYEGLADNSPLNSNGEVSLFKEELFSVSEEEVNKNVTLPNLNTSDEKRGFFFKSPKDRLYELCSQNWENSCGTSKSDDTMGELIPNCDCGIDSLSNLPTKCELNNETKSSASLFMDRDSNTLNIEHNSEDRKQLKAQSKDTDHVTVEDVEDIGDQIISSSEDLNENIAISVSNDQSNDITPSNQSDTAPVNSRATRSPRANPAGDRVQALRDICFKYEESIRQCPSLLIVIELFSDQLFNGVKIDFELLERGLQRISQPSTTSNELNSNGGSSNIVGGLGSLLVHLGSTMNHFFEDDLIPFISSKIDQSTRSSLPSECRETTNTLEQPCSNSNTNYETPCGDDSNSVRYPNYLKNLAFPLSLLRSSILSKSAHFDRSSNSDLPDTVPDIGSSTNNQQIDNTNDMCLSSSLEDREGDYSKDDSVDMGSPNRIGCRKGGRKCHRSSSSKSKGECRRRKRFHKLMEELDPDEAQSLINDHLSKKCEVFQQTSGNEAPQTSNNIPQDQSSQPKESSFPKVESTVKPDDQNNLAHKNESQSFDESFECFQSRMLPMREVFNFPFNFNLFDRNRLNFDNPSITEPISSVSPIDDIPRLSSQSFGGAASTHDFVVDSVFNNSRDRHLDNYRSVQPEIHNINFSGFNEVTRHDKITSDSSSNPFGDEFEIKSTVSQPLVDTSLAGATFTSRANEPLHMGQTSSQINSQNQVEFENFYSENVAILQSNNNPSNNLGNEINPADVELLAGLNSLREMGFPNDISNLEALQQFDGDIEKAVEHLIQAQFAN